MTELEKILEDIKNTDVMSVKMIGFIKKLKIELQTTKPSTTRLSQN